MSSEEDENNQKQGDSLSMFSRVTMETRRGKEPDGRRTSEMLGPRG
jgi:hypothetical protein